MSKPIEISHCNFKYTSPKRSKKELKVLLKALDTVDKIITKVEARPYEKYIAINVDPNKN